MQLRIPAEEVFSDKRLLKEHFFTLSVPQQTAIRSIYGLPLNTSDELACWSAQQGAAQYDDLGYVQSVRYLPYVPKKYSEAWIVCGRRAGKTDRLASTILAYESLFGGHEEYARKGQRIYCFQIAQDQRMAQYSLHFIRATIESSPVGIKLIEQVTADRIDLTNGVTIKCLPPTLKAVRGFACPVAVMDEVGVWYQDSDSANPDYEIYRAIRPAQMQFPDRVLVGVSSPWNKNGLLWTNYAAGTEGRNAPKHEQSRYRNVIVIHGTTASMGNPLITRGILEEDRDRDPRSFERESLAVFQDSISGFLNTTLLKEAVDVSVTERAPSPEFQYVGAIDPAFRQDAFAFTICHVTEQGTVVQDYVERFLPPAPGEAINPENVIAQIVPVCQRYKIQIVHSDQWHLESLQQLFIRHGLLLDGVPFKANNKAEIFGSLKMLLNQRRLRILDHRETVKELAQLELKLSGGGNVQIAAPSGMHDDMAAVMALACYKALWNMPMVEGKKKADAPEQNLHQRVLAQIERGRSGGSDVLTAWD